MTTSGYLHERYAQSFSEWAEPLHLSRADGWLLSRTIPGTASTDLIGCYPLFCCRDWKGLARDLDDLTPGYVSLALVADTFGRHSPDLLASTFDIVRGYKNHFIVEPNKLRDKLLPRKHRRNLSCALKSIDIEICPNPLRHLDEWCALYAHLCRRHSIIGIQALSRLAHERQLSVPDLVMLRASAGGRTVGIHLWYQQGEFAYGHLGATNDAGYELMASYALYWHALQHFQDRVNLIDIGSTPGTTSASGDGLARFKRGWATGTRMVYFCGRILDREKYALLACRGAGRNDFFPAYRTTLSS
jgi:Acetyltransferase (GNAT) domain